MRKGEDAGSVLVVGGGISGMQSCLSLAGSGYKVYLLEKSEEIGGHVGDLGKSFPRTGCSVCALSPKPEIPSAVRGGREFKRSLFTRPCQSSEIEGGWHENIEVLECSNLKDVEGELGNFEVTITGNPGVKDHNIQFNDVDKAEGWGRKRDVKLDVDSIILSLGFKEFDPASIREYDFENPNVVSSTQFERMLSNHGPILRPSDREPPERIAFIQCVGSRDTDNNYCSSVCCMYTAKQAINVKEIIENVSCTVFYMDKRVFGKYYERLLSEAEEEDGVKYVKSRPSRVIDDEKDDLTLLYERGGETKEEKFDMVVLSTGLEPPEDVKKIAKATGIQLDEHGFVKTEPFSPLQTSRPGIFVSGALSSPKDIPESVAQGIGAASKASNLVSAGHGSVEGKYGTEKDEREEEPRIGVFICRTDIENVLDVQEVVDYVKAIPDVGLVDANRELCSRENRETIKERIEDKGLNRVVIAGCTPRIQESLFRETCQEAGLNPLSLDIANIREQCAWVHYSEPEKATEKAKHLVKMSVVKSRLQELIDIRKFGVTNTCLVIGGGLSGIVASLELAKKGFNSFLVEKRDELGGRLRKINYLLGDDDPQEKLQKLIDEVRSNDKVKILTGTEVVEIDGYVGKFTTKLTDGTKLKHGAIIIATGAEELKPTEYFYEEDERVITQLELEERLEKLDTDTVVMIQCVGSRSEERPYCCRIGCSEAIKNALQIKGKTNAEVYILYRDIQSYGLRESYYGEAREKGVKFIRFEKGDEPDVERDGDGIKVRVEDSELGKEVTLSTDLLVLSPAIVPREDNMNLSELLNVPLDEDGFFREKHKKLRPVDSLKDGIFICGMSHSPKFVEESISQACAAAQRASIILSKDVIEAEEMVVDINKDQCGLCKACISVCPFDAIMIKEGEVQVLDALCKGCGTCVAVCPSSAIQQKGLKNGQITRMMEAYLD